MVLNDIRHHMRMDKTVEHHQAAVQSSRSMPRKPKKIKPGSGLVQLTFLVDASIAGEIDDYAARLTADDPMRPASRTDALRKLIRAGLDTTKHRTK
jgi:hypothetical protein